MVAQFTFPKQCLEIVFLKTAPAYFLIFAHLEMNKGYLTVVCIFITSKSEYFSIIGHLISSLGTAQFLLDYTGEIYFSEW